MSLTSMLERLFGNKKSDTLADYVARRTADEVWQRVCLRAPEMQRHEAAGYVRSHALAVVRGFVEEEVLPRTPLGPAKRDAVVSAAASRLVQSLVGRAMFEASDQRAANRAA